MLCLKYQTNNKHKVSFSKYLYSKDKETQVSTFKTGRAFSNFEREVKKNRRYIRTREAEHFLSSIRRTCDEKLSNISQGRQFWRAQAGHRWRNFDESDQKIPTAYASERMVPLTDRAMEGRANSKGIPVLYLCSNKEAAMSEIRPWLGSMISLSSFQTTRDLRVINCVSRRKTERHFLFEELSKDEIDENVWSEIDRAFTKPVTRSDDTGEYVATQILTELFRDAGYDGIAYRSAFGEHSMNLALFDLKSAEVKTGHLFEATSAKINFRERDNPYWVRSSEKSRSKKKSKP